MFDVRTSTRHSTTPGVGSPVPIPRRRRRTRRRILLGVAACVLALAAIVTERGFVRPPLGSVRHPQAVVVLDGYGAQARVRRGFALARSDHVRFLVVSIAPGPYCPRSPQGLQVVCFVPDPQSTQGEARAVARIAGAHHWARLLVVAGTTQIARARLRLDRCFEGRMAFSGVDPAGLLGWLHYVAYDEAAMLKAELWQRQC